MLQTTLLLLLSGPSALSAEDVAVSPDVFRRLDESAAPVKVWVEFVDKGLNDVGARAEALARLESSYPERARERRRLRRSAPGLFDERDLPLCPAYVAQVEELGIEVHVEARWLNSLSATVSSSQLAALRELDSVQRIHLVGRGQRLGHRSTPSPLTSGGFYGAAQDQIEQLNLHELHNLGFTGQGIVIGVLDTGFLLSPHAFNDAARPLDVLDAYDFVDDDPVVGPEPGDHADQHVHGTLILGTLGAYQPGVLVGGAYDASFLLAKTEDVRSETAVEEDYYVAGLQWIEQNGGDVATSSLGYIDWYQQSDLDGQTATTTIAVNVATANGLLCVTAAGNKGNDTNPSTSHLIAPADAFEVFSCGSVASTGEPSTFSSDGPTADGRVKPELMARGEATWTVSPWDDQALLTASGTSLSTPLIASVVACLAQAGPSWDVTTLRERLMRTASLFDGPRPDPLFVYGHGIPDALAALQLGGTWTELGGGVAGVQGIPGLGGEGPLVGTETTTLRLDSARANAPYFLVLGFSRVDLAYKGGSFVPAPDLLFLLSTDAAGGDTLSAPWAPGLPDAFELYFQAWVLDPAGPLGMSASNGLQATTPTTGS